jgi:type II secretory pathway pseudopilin PulG
MVSAVERFSVRAGEQTRLRYAILKVLMLQRNQAGFTLIEVTIFLAISSMLAIMAIVGFSNTRGQTQFSDSVEQLTQQVLQRRQEALSTVKTSGSGNDATQVTFGKVLTFTRGSGAVRVETVRTANYPLNGTNPPVSGQAVTVIDTTTFPMAWGVTYNGAQDMQVAFSRSTMDGALQTTAWNGAKANYTYGDFTPPANVNTTFNVNVIDPGGRQAHLIVDPAKNGISRAYP